MKRSSKTVFRCQACGQPSAKWLGRCPSCEGWNTFVEEVVASSSKSKPRGAGASGGQRACKISDIGGRPFMRHATGLGEFDRLLGGGLVEGSLTLVGGPPGIGKSTLLMQVAGRLLHDGKDGGGGKAPKVLYISGEESLDQVKMRVDRLGVKADDMLLLAETNMDDISAQVDECRPDYLVVDSIQTVYRPDLESAPGSVSQVRECASVLMDVAKSRRVTTLLCGHVTKEGSLAGPRVLEHMVDTVLYFEQPQYHTYRILRAVKNRFGPTSEIGIFDMTERGLEEVPNPSEIFLSEQASHASGSVVISVMEGTRPLLVEMQSLVSQTPFGMPRRMVTGLEFNRAVMLIAVLERRAGIALSNQDVFVNLAGGVRVKEPAADLGAACAIASAALNFIADKKTVAIGEVGLGGEVRSVSFLGERIAEARRLGFERCIVPRSGLSRIRNQPGIRIHPVGTASEAIASIKS